MEKLTKYSHVVILMCIWFLSFILSTSGASSSKYIGVYNSTCDPRDPLACDDPQMMDHKTYLECLSKKCLCPGHTHYDKKNNMCLIKVKSQCPTRGDSKGYIHPCTIHAGCAYPLDIDGNQLKNAVHGTCKCFKGYPETPELTCSSTRSNHGSKTYNSFAAILIGILTTWKWTVLS